MMRAEQRAEPKRLVLFGLGPHARRIYYPLIARFQKEHCLELALLVELEDKRKVVEAYIRSASMKPERVLYLPPEERKGSQLHPTFVGAARRALDTGLWGAVVSTEPRAHYIFSKWAIDNGLHVLVDKPVTAFDIVDVEPSKALRLVDEYFDLRRAADRARVSFLVQAHRRAHAGYDTLRRYLAAFVTEVQIPVTYIDIFHMPSEWNRSI